mmetsp:Transcript_13045/g.20259  ORF Transcript_13045/g.20259 Transcript_13045/m.20259 type:complete len:672 (-) Transcript_13045:878-2893(-)
MTSLRPKGGKNTLLQEQMPENITGKTILGEIIGGTNLHSPALKDGSSLHPFVVVLRVKKRKLKGSNSEEILVRTKQCKDTNNPIWSINQRCLFLFTTPDIEEKIDSYKIQFDVRDKSDLLVTNPLDCKLVGSCTMPVRDIIDSCLKRPEERIELQLEASDVSKSSEEGNLEDMSKIAVRFRFATEFDEAFMEKFGKMKGTFASYLHYVGNTRGILTARTGKTTYTQKKTQAQIIEPITTTISGQQKELVQPGPDPGRSKSTRYLTNEQMKAEMKKPSTNWTQLGGGMTDGDLGELYLEILNCEKLPNTDAPDGILGFGYKTDPFVCAIYDEFCAHTDIIENRLSPMWMPWTQRSFRFSIKHPFSQLFLSINDYNSLTSYVSIGRIQINLNHFEPNIMYTLKYNIHPASNVNIRESKGTITIRLRKVMKNEKALLMSTLKPRPNLHTNIEDDAHLAVARFACYGKHDEDVYDMMFIWYYIKEILDIIKFSRFAISDAIGSLIMWRGQVKVRDMYLPVHSAIAFVGGIYFIERPHLLPGCFFLSLAWLMLASMIHRQQNPSIWHKTNSFFYYLAVLLNMKPTTNKTVIKSMENAENAAIYEANWEHRINFSQEIGRKNRDLNYEVERIGNEKLSDEHKKKWAQKDPLSKIISFLLCGKKPTRSKTRHSISNCS